MGNIVRWGIIGCGKIAQKFALDLALCGSGILTACSSRDEKRAIEFSLQHNVEKYFTDYHLLANCPDIDAVYIATPHSHHYVHTLLSLDANKAVLCEKPLTVNEALGQKVIEVALKKNCLLMEAMWTAFLPSIQEIKSKIEHGIIGEVRHLRADFGFKAEIENNSRLLFPLLAGGSLLDIGIYPLFISIFLMGVPEDVVACGHLSGTGVDDECTIMLKFKNGATAVLYSSFTIHTDTKCEIFGTKGKISIPTRFHEQNNYSIHFANGKNEHFETDKKGYGYSYEIEHFNQCLISGLKESPVMTYNMSLDILRIMDSVRKQIGFKYIWD